MSFLNRCFFQTMQGKFVRGGSFAFVSNASFLLRWPRQTNIRVNLKGKQVLNPEVYQKIYFYYYCPVKITCLLKWKPVRQLQIFQVAYSLLMKAVRFSFWIRKHFSDLSCHYANFFLRNSNLNNALVEW